MNTINVTTPKTKAEIEQCCARLLQSGKPKMIVACINGPSDLSEQQLKHFRTAEYLWNAKPQVEGPYKDKFMGLLLDESLNYVHIVFASQEGLNHLFDL